MGTSGVRVPIVTADGRALREIGFADASLKDHWTVAGFLMITFVSIFDIFLLHALP